MTETKKSLFAEYFGVDKEDILYYRANSDGNSYSVTVFKNDISNIKYVTNLDLFTYALFQEKYNWV